jgi:hypothetical protein
MDIKIDFERGTDPYFYRDALYFTEEQFDMLSPAEIEQMKDKRYNDWYTLITTPSETVQEVPTVQNDFISVNGISYEKLIGTPTSGAILIEANGIWYKKVDA